MLFLLPSLLVNCCFKRGKKPDTNEDRNSESHKGTGRLRLFVRKESQTVNKELYYKEEPRNSDLLMTCGRGDRPRMFFDINPEQDPRYITVKSGGQEAVENCRTTEFARLQWYPGQPLEDEKAPEPKKVTARRKISTMTVSRVTRIKRS